VQPLLQWKSNNYYYSECLFVAFATQYIMRMCRIILSSVTCLAVPYFQTLCYKMARFSGKNILRQNECSGFFYNYVGKVFIIRRVILKIIVINVQTFFYNYVGKVFIIRRVILKIVINVQTSSYKVHVILIFLYILNFLDRISKRYTQRGLITFHLLHAAQEVSRYCR